MAERKTIAIESIRRDGGTQTRAGLNAELVTTYAERLKAGDAFPVPVVFHDGDAFWLADGFHRVEAHVVNGRARVECEVRKGGDFEAFLFGLGANQKHDKSGLRRSNPDKRHSVEALFAWLSRRDENWSDRRVADACGVGYSLVTEVRQQLPESGSSRPRTGADGKVRNLPKPKAQPEAPNPYVAIECALDAAQTRTEAECAYTALTRACEAGEVTSPEAEKLAKKYQARLAVIDAGRAMPESANTDNDEEEDGEPEVFEGDEPPVLPAEPIERGWGSADVSQHVMRIIAACRDAETKMRALYDDIDPRFAVEVRQRAQDTVLRLMKALDSLLPPDGARAENNRSKFGVLTGGKSK